MPSSKQKKILNYNAKDLFNIKHIMKNDLKYIKENWPKNLPNGIIHCDLFVDNIFFYKNKFYGFIIRC